MKFESAFITWHGYSLQSILHKLWLDRKLNIWLLFLLGRNPAQNQSASPPLEDSAAFFLKLVTQTVPTVSAGLSGNKKHVLTAGWGVCTSTSTEIEHSTDCT